jgi:hypothetical protein
VSEGESSLVALIVVQSVFTSYVLTLSDKLHNEISLTTDNVNILNTCSDVLT